MKIEYFILPGYFRSARHPGAPRIRNNPTAVVLFAYSALFFLPPALSALLAPFKSPRAGRFFCFYAARELSGSATPRKGQA